jgi:ABC-type uncharacterized transport system auxiliary subunit
MRRLGWLLVASAFLAGCLFRNTSAPPRFFAPGPVAAEGAAGGATSEVSRTGAAIQLRAVSGTAFLRERVVWRRSPVEYGQYENRLWCELPATYVQRALARALRRTPGLRLSDDVRAPALRVEVLAFDEVLAPAHTATVSLAASLGDSDGGVLLDRTFTADASIAGNDPAMMAQAMGRALDEVTRAVAAAVATAMRAR